MIEMSESEIDDLNEALDAVIRDGDTLRALSPAVSRLLEVAAGLRGLPSPDFKERLRSELAAAAAVAPLITPERLDGIPLALQELARAPRLQAHDLTRALSGMPNLGMRFLETLNGRTVGVSRFSGPTHWERHPAADELLYFVDGEAEVTTLTAGGPVVTHVDAGSLFVCPRGFWHRVQPKDEVSILFATPGAGTEHSKAEFPSPSPHADLDTSRDLVAHDARAALSGVPVLDITATSTAEEADAAFVKMTDLDECALYTGRFRGLSPWERHRSGDELVYVLDGEVEITVLTDEGPARRTVRQGSVFVCPRALWHRQHARGFVTILSATPGPSDASWADDPRT
jgi:quercetin dioxygenase-like cupin family protein